MTPHESRVTRPSLQLIMETPLLPCSYTWTLECESLICISSRKRGGALVLLLDIGIESCKETLIWGSKTVLDLKVLLLIGVRSFLTTGHLNWAIVRKHLNNVNVCVEYLNIIVFVYIFKVFVVYMSLFFVLSVLFLKFMFSFSHFSERYWTIAYSYVYLPPPEPCVMSNSIPVLDKLMNMTWPFSFYEFHANEWI